MMMVIPYRQQMVAISWMCLSGEGTKAIRADTTAGFVSPPLLGLCHHPCRCSKVQSGQSLSALAWLWCVGFCFPGSGFQLGLFAEFLVLVISPSVQLVLSCRFLPHTQIFFSCSSKDLVLTFGTIPLLSSLSMVQVPAIFVETDVPGLSGDL